jgi:hypothetical protein
MIKLQRRMIKLQKCENTEQMAEFAAAVSIPCDPGSLSGRERVSPA